jgi:signal recognition particle subunit SRP72
MMPVPKGDRLFHYQQNIISQNEIALELLASKFNGVINTTARYISNHEKHISSHGTPTVKSDVNAMSVSNAAAHAQNQLGKLGLKSILPLLEKRPHDVGLILVIIHLYMLTNNPGSAITVLEIYFKRLDESKATADQDVRFAPGLVAIMVSLYSTQGRKSHIRTELAKAASYWRHKSKPPSSLLTAAGLSLLSSSNPEDLNVAGDIFEGLHKGEPHDKQRLAGYVAAYALTDLPKVRHAVQQLTPVVRLTAGIDVASLESAGVPQTRPAVIQPSSKKRPAEADLKPVKKRVRKSRLPKDYDPSKPADPERWLPLRDRSTYKPKGKKGKQKQAAQTQGGVNEKAAEGLNISNSDATATKPANTVISAPSKQSKKKKPKK